MKNKIKEILESFKDYIKYYDSCENKDKYSIYNYILKPDDMKIIIEFIENGGEINE